MFEFAYAIFEDGMYAVKCFTAGMLAVYMALKLGLPRPFWALTTVYVVSSQPFTGMIRSRSLYRICGTIISAIVVILAIPLLHNYRPVFLLATALWVGGCLYLSLLERTARSYIFRLSAYTAGIIAFPLLASPDIMSAAAPFDQALARVEEIILGIFCATLIHSIAFPRHLDKRLLTGLDKLFSSAIQWLDDILTDADNEKGRQRQKLSQDITTLRLMTAHAPFDLSRLRWLTGIITLFHDRLALLVMAGAELEEYKNDLHKQYPELLNRPWNEISRDIVGWMQNNVKNDEKSQAIREKIRRQIPRIHAGSSWNDYLCLHYGVLLYKLVNVIESCAHWKERIDTGQKSDKPIRKPSITPVSNSTLQTEKRLAFRTATAAAVATIIGCAIWIISGWHEGYYIPTYACIISCIFAMQDDPTPNTKRAMRSVLLGFTISLAYLWLAIPYTHSFEMLCLVLAPFLIFMGYTLIRPSPIFIPTLVVAGVSGMLSLYEHGIPDANAFFNGQMAQVTGMGLGIILLAVFRRVNLEKMAYYLAEACWTENALIGQSAKPPGIHALAVRMTDRIALITTRLSSVKDRRRMASLHLMRDILTSMNMAELKSHENWLVQNDIPVEPLMSSLSDYFRNKLDDPSLKSELPLPLLDTCLRKLAKMEHSPQRSRAISTLVGIRNDLFPTQAFS